MATGLVFREARRDDVAAVVALLAEDWIGAGDADPARAEAGYDAMVAAGNTRLFVGAAEGEILACYQLSILTGLSLSAPVRAQLEGVRVRADRRGAGLGAVLLADVEARARAAGATLIQLTSNASRAGAHRFYLRHGFTASHTGFKRKLDG